MHYCFSSCRYQTPQHRSQLQPDDVRVGAGQRPGHDLQQRPTRPQQEPAQRSGRPQRARLWMMGITDLLVTQTGPRRDACTPSDSERLKCPGVLSCEVSKMDLCLFSGPNSFKGHGVLRPGGQTAGCTGGNIQSLQYCNDDLHKLYLDFKYRRQTKNSKTKTQTFWEIDFCKAR